MNSSRRRVIGGGALALGTVAMSGWIGRAVEAAAAAASGESTTKFRVAASAGAVRSVSLVNLHTGDSLQVEYARDDVYDPAALAKIQRVLRDFRNGADHPIDPRLMDTLHDVALRIGVEPRFHVISGYRSPQTNERLRERSQGVAKHSMHMEGRAIDVRLDGVDCARLADVAREMARGGVGYYRNSNFVHLDTGAFRSWNG